jgi:hypothetical protein
MYRQIHTSIWKKSWFLDLEPQEKLLFVYLFSNDQTHLTGLYELPLRVMAFETGLDLAFVKATLIKLDKLGKVHYDYERSLIWVVNLLEHNAENRTSPKIQPHILAQFRNIPDCELRRQAIGHYNGLIPETYRIDTLSIPMPQQADQGADTASEQGQGQQSDTDESEPTTKSQNLHDDASPDALALLLAMPMNEPNASKVATAGLDYVQGWLDEFNRRTLAGHPPNNPPGLLYSFWESGSSPPKPPPPRDDAARFKRSIDGEYAAYIEH